MCFVDVACIHQADYDLMRQGIQSIGGFLLVSRELRILWSPVYLCSCWNNPLEDVTPASLVAAGPSGRAANSSKTRKRSGAAAPWLLPHLAGPLRARLFPQNRETRRHGSPRKPKKRPKTEPSRGRKRGV